MAEDNPNLNQQIFDYLKENLRLQCYTPMQVGYGYDKEDAKSIRLVLKNPETEQFEIISDDSW